MNVKPGWEKKKRDSMPNPGVTEIAYIHQNTQGLFVVVADHTGVEFRGDSPKFVQGGSLLEDFAWVLSDAMREYLKLKRGRIQIPGDNEVKALQ